MKNIVSLIAICTCLYSCSKDEIPEPSLYPFASFTTEKSIYDDGEIIRFINTSENADSFVWLFGNSKISSEVNPTFEIDLKNFMGYEFTALLTAYAADGRQDTCARNFSISKRILSDIHIIRMDTTIRQMVAETNGIESKLIVYMGPLNDPLEWIVPEQTLHSFHLNLNDSCPHPLNLMVSWPNIAMNNENWFIRFSSDPLTGKTGNRIRIREFIFNPCRIEFEKGENGMRQFTVEDEKMAIAVQFYYI